MRRALLLTLLAAATACSGPTVQPGAHVETEDKQLLQAQAPLAPSQRLADWEAAEARLEAVCTAARRTHSPVVAIVHAEWCEPCNELQLHVLDTKEGKALLSKAGVLSIDFDTREGGALASRLRVLGLPTTLVLVPGAFGLVEVGRIEGFEAATEYQARLKEALARTEPPPPRCEELEQLPGLDPPEALLDALECAATWLTTDPSLAYNLLVDFSRRDWPAAALAWPEPQRARLFDVLRLLGRYQARVEVSLGGCAETFGALARWPGTPKDRRSGAIYWQAACLVRNDQTREATQVLDGWLQQEHDSPQAKELVADLFVHEHIAAERAQHLLQEVLAATPKNDWPHYLLAELAAAHGDKASAAAHLKAALELRPGVALYLNHLNRLDAPPAP